MRSPLFVLVALVMILAGLSAISCAMPPHPDLLNRVRAGEMAAPYAMQHAAALRARGVDAPSQVRTIDMLRRRSLDDNVNILAIIVDFSDHTHQVQPSFFDTLLYGEQVGTLRQFYEEVSYGNFTLMTVNPCAALGWQRAPQNYAYYVNGANGFGEYPNNAQKLVEDVIAMVDPVVDFSQYDNDGNGYVDGLFVIHSGPGAEFTGSNDDIWSHAWSLSQDEVRDGVSLSSYSMEPEYWNFDGDMTCGVFCHEMGHAMFGFPDLYDYGYDSEGLGRFSLMAAGSWNGPNHLGDSPAHPDAFCTVQAGFVVPTVITANAAGVSIPCTYYSPTIFRLWTDGSPGSEYFLIENRALRGSDASLPCGGLLIYHVDEMVYGNDDQWYPGHEDEGHYEVALEQSDGQWDMEQNSNAGTSEDPYPGALNRRSFTNQSTPGSRDYNNNMTLVGVRNISNAADTMTADFTVSSGAGNSVFVQMPDTTAVSGDTLRMPVLIYDLTGQTVTSISFTIKWDPNIVQPAEPFRSLTGGLIPEGWSLSETHSADSTHVEASGSTPLSGEGRLLRFALRVVATTAPTNPSPIRFTSFVCNEGVPTTERTDGSVMIVTADINVSPEAVAFGQVGVGHTLTRSVICRNTGNGNLVISAVTAPACFTTNFSTPITIVPGSWQPVRVTFAPDSARLYRDTLRLFSNAPGNETDILLNGEGVGPGGIADGPISATPTEFALSPNYPNPFNPSTSVSFDVPRVVPLTITVYDVLGREIDVPFSGVSQPGRHTLAWSCPSCASGVYLFVLSADGKQIMQKAMLMR